jgi:hypothetical protein
MSRNPSGSSGPSEVSWKWVSSGEELSYSNWNVNEPNNGNFFFGTVRFSSYTRKMGCSGAKASGGGGKGGQLESVTMKKIGPDSFDSVFKDAGELLNGVIDLNNRLNESTEQFRTLTALTDAKATIGTVVKEFKKKLSEAKVKIILRTTDDGELKVELDVNTDMIPPTLKGAYDAAIGLVDNIKKIIKETPELKEKVEKVVESVKAFSDADKVKSDLEAAGITGFDLVKAVKAVANNVEETTRTPKILQQLVDTAQDTVKQLQEGFAEVGANMEKNAADASAAAGGEQKSA